MKSILLNTLNHSPYLDFSIQSIRYQVIFTITIMLLVSLSAEQLQAIHVCQNKSVLRSDLQSGQRVLTVMNRHSKRLDRIDIVSKNTNIKILKTPRLQAAFIFVASLKIQMTTEYCKLLGYFSNGLTFVLKLQSRLPTGMLTSILLLIAPCCVCTLNHGMVNVALWHNFAGEHKQCEFSESS